MPYFLLHNNYILGENYKYLIYTLSHNDNLDVNSICSKIQPKMVLDEKKQANINCVKCLIDSDSLIDRIILNAWK